MKRGFFCVFSFILGFYCIFAKNMSFHPLNKDISLPKRFTFPFCYEPHPLCRMAAHEVCCHIENNSRIKKDADKGKMFGVLVVRDNQGNLGFLAAYSGLLSGNNDHKYFVPPVFDSQQPDGYFKRHEKEISAINTEIKQTENDKNLSGLIEKRDILREKTALSVYEYKKLMTEAKRRRDERRHSGASLPDSDMEAMTRESQFMKAELRRIKRQGDETVKDVEESIAVYETRIAILKKQRHEMSDALQQWLFNQYVMLNARGEKRALTDIFADTPQKVPPAGAGDCCAPKLLQYAYLNDMHPLCMAEFWWGKSPKTEIRRHLNYYPACSGKCKPILGHMLQGLNVDPDPQTTDCPEICIYDNGHRLETIYEDRYFAVVCKPAGMLSVPGKNQRISVLSIMQEKYPEATGPMIVHRLDMSTSGLLIVAKTKKVHKDIQKQFAERTVKKRYVALLEKPLKKGRGHIKLPLIADPFDRPRQKVDKDNGKLSITEYEITGQTNGHARVTLYPHTGRTHQLRVHCAHTEGLDCPILGDGLYGHTADRLYLHAEAITITHPISGRRMTFERKAEF